MSKNRLHIFRAGRHVPMSGGEIAFSEADVAGMAESYDPALRRAPLVVGHPRLEDDAKGWVRALQAEGADLRAEVEQLEPAFAEAVRAGRYGALSASFYTPRARGNPQPGRYYLKHVGFLGAVGPAVHGLDPIAFAEPEEGVVTLAFSEAAEPLLEPDDPPSVRGGPMADPTPPPVDPAAREAALKAREEALQAREAAFAETRRAARAAEDEALLGDLIAQGRLAPAAREGLIAFMETLGAEDGDAVAFSEGGAAETPRDWFRGFLRAAPAVSFAELSAPGASAPADRPSLAALAERHAAAARAAGDAGARANDYVRQAAQELGV